MPRTPSELARFNQAEGGKDRNKRIGVGRGWIERDLQAHEEWGPSHVIMTCHPAWSGNQKSITTQHQMGVAGQRASYGRSDGSNGRVRRVSAEG